jgi:hypothetical protein
MRRPARGTWKGKRLISDTPLLAGHAGGNSSLMDGWYRSGFMRSQVTAKGVSPRGLEGTVRDTETKTSAPGR